MATLEQELENTASTLNIPEAQFRRVWNLLEQLRAKHVPTYEHSVRVGVSSVRFAQHISNANPKLIFCSDANPTLMFYSGTLHDIGKIKVRTELLTKTHGFGPADMEEMKEHATYSYEILKDIYACSAEVAVRHHVSQSEGYPEVLPDISIPVNPETEAMINYHARLLSIADSYDATSTRKNDKHGAEGRLLNPKEVRKIMIDGNPDQVQLVNELYRVHIFGQQN